VVRRSGREKGVEARGLILMVLLIVSNDSMYNRRNYCAEQDRTINICPGA